MRYAIRVVFKDSAGELRAITINQPHRSMKTIRKACEALQFELVATRIEKIRK